MVKKVEIGQLWRHF